MSTHRISIDTPLVGQFMVDLPAVSADDPIATKRILSVLEGIATGEYQGKIRINLNAVQASGLVTFNSFADADTITVNGTQLTGRTTPTLTTEFAVGASNQACANNFMAKINASALAGIVGCVAGTRKTTIVPASMVAGDTITINGIVFTVTATPILSSDILLALNDTNQAKNIVAKVNAHQSLDGVVAAASGTTVTLTFKGTLTTSASAHATVASDKVNLVCIIPGVLGNSITQSISTHGSVVSPFAGGSEGTEFIDKDNNPNAL